MELSLISFYITQSTLKWLHKDNPSIKSHAQIKSYIFTAKNTTFVGELSSENTNVCLHLCCQTM